MSRTGIDRAFWNGRRVLVIGHTGFKGGWLTLLLAALGCRVGGYALAPEGEPSLFTALALEQDCRSVIGDLRDLPRLRGALADVRPEIVFHLAAQPLVRRSYREPLATWETNVLGTAHVLEACRGLDGLKAVVVITTDKVYHNEAWPWGYRETDRLGGEDPYSASKAAAELVTQAWRASFLAGQGVGVVSARAGNVIGGGDWGEDRLVPDAIRAFTAGRPLTVRNPASVRPWQHVFDLLAGYLLLAQACWRTPQGLEPSWNFGPDAEQTASVGEVADILCAAWGEDARWHWAAEAEAPREAVLLRLDSSLARARLGWRPLLGLRQGLAATAEWHRHHRDWGGGERLRRFSRQAVEDLLACACC